MLLDQKYMQATVRRIAAIKEFGDSWYASMRRTPPQCNTSAGFGTTARSFSVTLPNIHRAASVAP